MPNYSLVINSQFKPFSYQEMLAPTLMATQAHQELENQYGELAAKANVWEEMANEQTDPYAYKMYKTYANDLLSQAGQLAREGLNAASRRDMLNMRSRYSKEIVPIEQAYTARLKQVEEQQKALLQDPTLMLSRRAATTSLDDYIRNPLLNYDAYSGKLITALAALAAGALSKEMRDNPRKWRSILGNSYYETVMQKGFNSNAVLQAILNNPNAAPELLRIVEDAVNSSGVRNWGDEATVNRAYDYARQGLWSAIGETQYLTLDDWRRKMAEQEAMLKRAEQRAYDIQNPNRLTLNPLNIYGSRELSEKELTYNNNVKNFSKYFYKDAQGRTRLNDAGMNEYRRNAATKVTTSGSGSGTARLMNAETQMQGDRGFAPTEFKKFMDSIGMDPMYGNIDNWNGVAIGNLWKNYVDNSPSARTAKYDATRVTEYMYDVDQSPEYLRSYKAKLSRAIGSDQKFKEVDYNPKTNRWEETGETLSFADFDTDDYSLVSRAPSELGSTLFIKKKGEKAKRYMAPPGVNTTAEGGRDQVFSEMLATQRLLQNPNLSSTQRAKLEKHYDNLTQLLAMFESQLDLTNRTKDQEFSPYYIP